MLRTVLSPHFLPCLDAVVGGVVVAAERCGTKAAYRDERGVTLPLFCDAPGGVCAACCPGAAVGAPVGKEAVQAFAAALAAFEAGRPTQPTVVLSWPGMESPPPGLARTLAVADAPHHLARLLEARPADVPATLSECDGEVELLGQRGARQLVRVTAPPVAGHDFRLRREYAIEPGLRLRKATGDTVRFAEPLSEGAPDPEQVLAIVGSSALARWVLADFQALLGAAGAALDARHLALLLRAMLQHVRIEQAGDSTFADGQLVLRHAFEAENRRVIAAGNMPALAQAAVLGVSALAAARR